MYTVNIKEWSAPLEVHKGTILEAALSQGVPYPHQCRVGECGNCKARLLSGTVKHDPHLADALTRGEKDQGYILACRARPKSDISLSWDKDPFLARHPIREFPARVTSIQNVCDGVVRLRLQSLEAPLEFSPGQYVRLSIGSLPARSFSMANRPGEAELEFHIRHVPDGQVSPYIADRMKKGDAICVEGPFGVSHLRAEQNGPIIAVAGGTGLAPMLSIVRTAVASGDDRAIHLYWGVKDEADVYQKNELELLARNANVKTHIVLSGDLSSPGFRSGYLQQALTEDFTNLRGASVYTAGSPAMVDAIKTTAMALSVEVDNIYCDSFTASGADEIQPAKQPFFRRFKWFN